jgi:ribosome-binding protein aMBF1 (putative translation factor)
MTAATVEPQAQVQHITQVADLPDEVKADLIKRRQNGETLAELRGAYPHVASEVIREVLPPANARERKARQSKDKKVTETTQGIGGRSGESKSEPKEKKAEEPKPAPAPRYVDKTEAGPLSDRVLAARKVLGRKDLSAALGISESATWRAEQDRIHPAEVEALTAALVKVDARIEAGEFKKAERGPKAKQPTKAELAHTIEVVTELLTTARGDKGISKANLVDAALAMLAVLAPPAQEAPATE